MQIPPIICSAFVGKNFLGSFDNPHDLEEALSLSLGFEEDGSIENTKDRMLLFFSSLNDNETSKMTYTLSKKHIKNRDSIQEYYNQIIDRYIMEFNNINQCEDMNQIYD